MMINTLLDLWCPVIDDYKHVEGQLLKCCDNNLQLPYRYVSHVVEGKLKIVS